MLLNKIKDTFQDCNINFLIGSGLSLPYLKTLGDIETLFTDLEKKEFQDLKIKDIIRASLYKKYFDEVIGKNPNILSPDASVNIVLDKYHNFLKILNSVLLKRNVTLLDKEINLFTTNVDIFLEKAIEDLSLEYNDGFNGRFKPKFSLSNFKKCHYKKSLHYDNKAEIPVFNILKLHGSLSWEIEDKEIIFSKDLNHVKEVEDKANLVDSFLDIPESTSIDELIAAAGNKSFNEPMNDFIKIYEKLLIIVNPKKEKFHHTLMNQTYYELLRLYSNELEKENTILFVMGFSFADEHICEITSRAANSNPTLMIYVIAHSSKAKEEIEKRIKEKNIKNNNIEFLSPEQEENEGIKTDKFKYDFENINSKIFENLLNEVEFESVAEDDKTA